MEELECPTPKRARLLTSKGTNIPGVAPVGLPEQVLLKNLQIEGFKTFGARQNIDICSGWQPRDGRVVTSSASGPPAPSPLTIVFGGNGAGKSAIFDAVFFVLGQSVKSMRSSGGSAQLVNDQVVLQKGPNATASVTITFQKSGGCQKGAERGNDRSVDGDMSASPLGSGSVQELTVGRSVKHNKGTSTYSVQGRVCSRTTMMQELNAFVGADMGDVDRYVLKQGSTMMCRREGKELLSFIERLAGTAKLESEVEEVQTALDDKREESLAIETDVQASVHARKGLQPQVQAFLSHQRDVADLQQEKTGLWHRQLASLRVRLDELETGVAKSETEATELEGKIKAKKSQYQSTERDLKRTMQVSENALKSQSAARGNVQKAKSAQAEDEALAKKALKSARAKGKTLSRARKLLEEGEAEVARTSAQACELDSAFNNIKARIHELEKSSELRSLPEGKASTERDKLMRELSSLEEGPLQELEKSVAERKLMIVKAGMVLDKLLSEARVVRLEMEESDKAATSAQKQQEALIEKINQMDAESVKLRDYCTSQQALVSNLEARRTAQEASANAAKRLPKDSESSPSKMMRRTISSGRQFPAPSAQGGVPALRSLIERLRDGGCEGDGVGVHGMLADLVLLRQQDDEAAVLAVLGPSLRNTVVVQTRKDGARVVAEVRAAGISGRVRCDVLDEISRGLSTTTADAAGNGQQRAGSSRLRPLSECVTTSDPLHLAAAEKHLRGWLLAETRQAAWGAINGPSKSTTATNVVTMSGELFFASGEVAVKAPSVSTRAPRLRAVRGVQEQPQRQQGGDSPPPAHQEHVNENAQDVEVRLDEALKSLSTAETRLAELARISAQARFDGEDAHAQHVTAQKRAKEYHREMLKMNQKVSAQRRLISASNECGIRKDPAADHADEVQLRNLLQRRDKIIAELTGGNTTGLEEAGSIDLAARDAALLELRNLRAEAVANRELRDEVKVKLRVLTKRGRARRDRVEALKAEKKDFEAQQISIKARQLLHEQKVAALLSTLEETKSVYHAKREAARQEEGAARKAKRELSALGAARAELLKRQELLRKDRRKTRADACQIVRSLAFATRTATDIAGSSPPNVLQDESEEGSETVDAMDAAAAARLSRTFDNFLRSPSHDNTVIYAYEKTVDLEPSDSQGDGGGGGSNDRDCNHHNSNKRRSAGRRGGAIRAEEGKEADEEKDFIQATDGIRKRSRSSENSCELATAPAAMAHAVCKDDKDEARVVAFERVLKAAVGGGGGGRGGVSGGERSFRKETAEAEASIRLKEAKLKIGHEAIDVESVAEAIRLDRESVDLERRLEATQESVLVLMEKKEVIQATRHAALVKCLEEVNEALGNIYGQLTSVENPTYPGSNVTANGKALGTFGVRGVPGGDCFLRFSRERSLLLSEGLAVQVKPEPSSPWRGPGSLSGGQVALVGLALNLATQAVRPAPLYLMDEIDSALDTHKVRRVASLLAARARSGSEQCIVISHRPEMQERGSHLIGVYHCEGTARTVGLELLPQLPVDGQQHDERSHPPPPAIPLR